MNNPTWTTPSQNEEIPRFLLENGVFHINRFLPSLSRDRAETSKARTKRGQDGTETRKDRPRKGKEKTRKSKDRRETSKDRTEGNKDRPETRKERRGTSRATRKQANKKIQRNKQTHSIHWALLVVMHPHSGDIHMKDSERSPLAW